MATERVSWDRGGVHIDPWLLPATHIEWSSLRALRTHKGSTVFVYETPRGRTKQITHVLTPERRAQLDDAWWRHQLAELERRGQHRVRVCAPNGGLVVVLMLGGGLFLAVASLFGVLVERSAETWPVVGTALFLLVVFGLALAGAIDGYMHQRRWQTAVFHRGGITRTDIAGQITETPWHRVRVEAGRVDVDGIPLKPAQLSGEPLTLLLVHTKATRAPAGQSFGIAGPLLARLMKTTLTEQLSIWNARAAQLAQACEWIDAAPPSA